MRGVVDACVVAVDALREEVGDFASGACYAVELRLGVAAAGSGEGLRGEG